MKIRFFFLMAIAFIVSCDDTADRSGKHQVPEKNKKVPEINWKYLNVYPHDTASFTEGFLMHNGKLFESTGSPDYLPQTRSLFGTVNLETGKIEVKAELDREKYFGEGIAIQDNKIYQLTYREKVGFIYDATTFEKIREFTIPTKEGWGITTNGNSLIMSDGTNVLTFLNPETLQVESTLSVTENNYVRDNLNELEFIEGFIFANVWLTNKIVKIDTVTGKVMATIDLAELADEAKFEYQGSQEMNGIAYDPDKKSILITGKLWPKIFEIELQD